MKTIIYFVRHAESFFVEGMERERGLSDKGISDARKVTAIFVECYLNDRPNC